MAARSRHILPQSGSPAMWLVIIGILLAELLFYTWIRVESTQTTFDISRAVYDQKKIMAYNTALSLEKASLMSPRRISRIAREELNRAAPDAEQVIYLQGDLR